MNSLGSPINKTFQFLRQYFLDESRSLIDKVIHVSILLCAFSIILSIVAAQVFAWVVILLSLKGFRAYRKREKTPFDLPLFVFVMVRFASILFSTDISASAGSLHTEIPYYALFFAITQQRTSLPARFVYALLWMFIIAAIIGSCYGSMSVLLGQQARASSLSSGYYTLGAYLTAVLSLTLVLGKSYMAKKRWLWYGLIILITIGIILTLNRIHWGIMTAAFLAVGLFQERKLLSILVIVFVLLLLFSPSVSHRLDQMVHIMDNLSGRDVLWKGATLIWSNHPILGYGPDTFLEIFPLKGSLEDKKVGGWHNDYLTIFIESGALGIISFLWLLSTIYYQAFIYFRRTKHFDEQAELVLAILAGLSAILLSSPHQILIRMMFMILLACFGLFMTKKEMVVRS